MEIEWKCKKCGADVPKDYTVCWNCQTSIDATLESKIESNEEKYLSAENYNMKKIQDAGRQLKFLGRFLFIFIFVQIIFSVYKVLAEDVEKSYYYFYNLFLFISVCIVAISIFTVADSLQEVIAKKKKGKKEN